MHEENAKVSGAEGARSLDEIIFTNLQNLCADQSGVTNPADDAEREDQFIDTSAEECHEGNREQQPRKGEEHVEEISGQKCVNPTTVVTGDGANDCADEG